MTSNETSALRPVTQAAPRATPAAETADELDLIFIEGLVAETVIGIDPEELHARQPVRLDLTIGVPRVLACSTDRIGDTIHYGEVRTAVLELFATHKLQLLESVAETIAQIVLQDFGARWVRVALAKPNKFPDLAAVGVVIERRRTGVPARLVALPAADMPSLLGSGLVPPVA